MTPPLPATARTRDLNDEFRRQGPLFSRTKFDGSWLIAASVQSEGPRFTWQAIAAVQNFDASNFHDALHREHQFGALDVAGRQVLWTIDYLERGTQFEAEDPSDNRRTCRIITIMLADDW